MLTPMPKTAMRTKTLAQLVAALFAFAIFLASSIAAAQTVTVNPGLVRKNADGSTAPERNANLKITDINRDDCIQDRSYDIPLTLASFDTTMNLQVWAGAQDCSTLANRTPATQQCWRVLDGSLPRQQSVTPNVKVRDILAVNKTKGDSYVGPSTVDVCSNKDSQTISLYFIWLKGDGSPIGSGGTQAFNVDTVGSPPPTSVKATTGDRLLNVSWTAITEQSDTDSYNVYCDATGTATDAGVSDATSSDAALADSATSTDASGDATTDAGSTATDAGTTSSDAGDPGVCGGTLLIPGQQAPASMVPCATVTGASSQSIVVKGLRNDTFYRVAVAAVDKYGNPGVLSNVTCETPADVIDFFETYRESGGQGGNCSMHSSDAPSDVLLGGFVGLFVFRAVRRKCPSRSAE